MKKSHLAAGVALAAFGAVVGLSAYANSKNPADAVEIAVRADNFRLTDQYSKSHELYYYKDAPAIHTRSPAIVDTSSSRCQRGDRGNFLRRRLAAIFGPAVQARTVS